MNKRLSVLAAGLFFLFWISALTSQSLMDLSDGLFFLFGIGILFNHSLKTRNWKLLWPKTTGLGGLWLIWIIIIAAGLFLNNPVTKETTEALLEFRWMLIFHVLCFTLAWIEWDAKKISGLLGILLFMILVSFVMFHFEKGDFRAGGPFGHSMPFAHTYGPATILATGLMLGALKQKTSWKWLSMLTAALGAVIIGLSMTRGVWIGVAVAVAGIAFAQSRKHGVLLTLALLAVFGGTMVFSKDARERAITTSSSTNPGDNQRKDIWRANIEIVKDYPLLGTGYSQNKNLLRSYYDKLGISKDALVSHAHNQYLHLLAGTGILGLICYLIFLFRVLQLSLRAYLRLKVKDPLRASLALGALGAQVCFIIGSLTESNFSIAKNRYMFLLMSAIGVSIYYRFVASTDFEEHQRVNALANTPEQGL